MVSAALNKAAVLIEALPYMRKFYGATFVIKYGGSVMRESALRTSLMLDLVLLKHIGINPVLVHGGGPEINELLGKLDLSSSFVNGLRVTSPEVMRVVQMVLSGQVNKDIVAMINSSGGRAVGLSGLDGPLIQVEPISPELGRVGRITNIDPRSLQMLSKDGYIPVVASLGLGSDGNSYNINADLVAGEVAVSLRAAKLIMLTDVEGISRVEGGDKTLISQLNPTTAETLLYSGEISGGMLPKLEACIRAIRGGVGRAHIIDGRKEHSLLLEIFTDTGIGTMVTPENGEDED